MPAASLFSADFPLNRLIAILRGVTPANVVEVGEALVEGGVRFIEVPLNTQEPLACIRLLSEALAPRGVHIGAGTVLSPAHVDAAAGAGATYIISPNVDPVVIRHTKARGLVSIPGIFTPSEGFAASAAGADFLKVFPAHILGPSFLREVRVVLPTPMIAVGGVREGNIAEYLGACAGVALGTALYTEGRPVDEVRQAAARHTELIRG